MIFIYMCTDKATKGKDEEAVSIVSTSSLFMGS